MKTQRRTLATFAFNRLMSFMARTGMLLTAIPMTADSLDAIPEAQRALYKEANGKFVLDVDGLEDTSGLKSALEKERTAARNASKQASAWQSLGKTPEEIQELLEAQRQAEEKKLQGAGEFDKLKQQILDQHKVELGKKDETVSKMRSNLERHLVDAQAVAAISELKGVPALLLPHVKSHVKVVEDGDQFVTRVVDASGNPRVNGKGEFLSIKDLVSEMRQDTIFGRAFEPEGTSGSGAQSGGGAAGKKTATQAQIDAMRPKDRASFFAGGGVVSG